jgi:hypothetical protein
MAIRVKLPKNVLTEIISNWDAWNLGYLKALLRESEVEELAFLKEELVEAFDDTAKYLEGEWRAYIAGSPGEIGQELSAVIDFWQDMMKNALLRLLRIPAG